MIMGLFDIFDDVVKIVTAPIEIAADVTRAVTKPMAEVAQDVVKEVKDLTK